MRWVFWERAQHDSQLKFAWQACGQLSQPIARILGNSLALTAAQSRKVD
jgi:hypothetical protein